MSWKLQACPQQQSIRAGVYSTFLAVRTQSVQIETVIGQFIMQIPGNFLLPGLDDIVGKFIDSAAFHADEMVMMLATVQFKNRIAAFEMMSRHQPGCFKLGQDPVNGRQPDFFVFIE